MNNTRTVLRLGTRGSLLARTQSQMVADLLGPFFLGTIELVIISTAGDREQTKALNESGGKGLFVKEIEEALQAQTIDLAVHSAKDLPMEIAAGLLIAGTPTRELANDVWLGHAGKSIAELPPGAVVGTTSLRRRAQLLALRPDVETGLFRGNIDTRLRKVAEGVVAGTFLAAAGLRRTGLMPASAVVLPTEQFIPAAGQGTLALECRENDALVRELVARIHDERAAASLAFERGIVAAFAGSCLAPIGVCAEPRGMVAGVMQSGWIARALVASPDGKEIARATLLTQEGSSAGLEALKDMMIQALEGRGAREILAQVS